MNLGLENQMDKILQKELNNTLQNEYCPSKEKNHILVWFLMHNANYKTLSFTSLHSFCLLHKTLILSKLKTFCKWSHAVFRLFVPPSPTPLSCILFTMAGFLDPYPPCFDDSKLLIFFLIWLQSPTKSPKNSFFFEEYFCLIFALLF